MDKTWSADDAKLLRELRTAAGVDRATFARRCTISVGQLAELEDGGSGRFYSEGIKSHTGRTLLARLGHVRPVQAAASAGPAASEPAPAPAAAAPVPAAAPAPIPDSAPEMQAGPRSQEPVSDVVARPVAEHAPERGKTWLAVLVILACAVIAALVWRGRTQPAPPAVPPQVAEPVVEVPAPPASAALPAASAPASAPVAETAPPPAPALPVTAAATPAATSEPRCPPASGGPAKFVPAKALRPGNYVYLEASRPTLVCVTDAKQQQMQVQVQPGAGETVNGTPPFTLQSAGWAQLRVFFQGVRVPLEEVGVGAGGLLLQAP